jgi:hypothetical protein
MTDFVESESTRVLIGYSLISIVLINIAYHILSMIRMIYCTVLKPLYYKIRNKKFCLKKNKKEQIEDSSAKEQDEKKGQVMDPG